MRAALDQLFGIIIAFALAAGLVVGCSWFRSQSPAVQSAVIDCSTVAWQDIFKDVSQAIVSGHAPDGSDWRAYLKSFGEDEATCAVSHFLSAPASAPAQIDPNAANRAHEFLVEEGSPKTVN